MRSFEWFALLRERGTSALTADDLLILVDLAEALVEVADFSSHDRVPVDGMSCYADCGACDAARAASRLEAYLREKEVS